MIQAINPVGENEIPQCLSLVLEKLRLQILLKPTQTGISINRFTLVTSY